MYPHKVITIANSYLRKDGNINSRKLNSSKSKHIRVLNLLKSTVGFLNDDFNNDFSYVLYYIVNHINEQQYCDAELCNNPKKLLSLKKGFQNYCSIQCSHNTVDYKNKIQKSWKSKSKKDIEKISTKRKTTTFKKYGVISTNMLDSVKNKKKTSTLENFGVEYPQQSDTVKLTTRNNYIKKYGVSNNTKIHISNIDDMNKEFIMKNFIINEKFDNNKFMDYYNVSLSYSVIKRKELCIDTPVIVQPSIAEQELSTLIQQCSVRNRSFIKPLEIDILSQMYKFGIEYNGLMWHSYGISKYEKFNNPLVNTQKHLNKTILVEDKDYQLYHIFENEWLDENTKNIWKSVISAKMNKTARIYARMCDIKEISSVESNEFLLNNHLQGKVNSSIRLGLYYENKIVAIMTFSKSRLSKVYEYELLRFCNKINTTVVGGFSKLLKYFERTYNPNSLVSYANRRWSTGNVYDKNGFIFSHNSIPNSFWFKPNENILYSRLKFQKHKLKYIKGFEYDPTKKGNENMFINGYRVIYDSGNKVYYKSYNKCVKECDNIDKIL
jgi:hypothetical protein